MDAGFFPDGKRVGRYQILKRLGGSGASEVLLAVSHGPHGFERMVVVKRLLPTSQMDASRERMLATEAVAYARLTHPAVVRLYDFFDHDGQPVLVLEYVDGLSLAELLESLREKRESLGDPAALYIASRVFAALAAAHAARDPRSGEFAPVIHRDVSPGSVLLPWDGFVKLGDFGFAKVKGLPNDASVTQRGLLKGTVGYMAPEQVLAEPITPRTDVYAGCLLLRELLLSTPAFDPRLPELELLRSMAEGRLPAIETLRTGLSRPLVEALGRGLARDPEARTLTAAEMGRILRQETDLAAAQMSLVDTLAGVRPSEARESTPATGTRLPRETPASGTMRFERIRLPPEALPSSTGIGGVNDSDSHPTMRYETPHPIIMLGATVPPAATTVVPPRRRRRKRSAALLFTSGAGLVAAVWLVGALLGTPSKPVVVGSRSKPPASAFAAAGLTPSPPHTATPIPSSPPSETTLSSAPVGPSPRALASVAPPSSVPPASATGEIATPAHAHGHRVFLDGHYAAPDSGATLTVPCGEHSVRIGSKGRDQRVDVPCGGSVSVDAP